MKLWVSGPSPCNIRAPATAFSLDRFNCKRNYEETNNIVLYWPKTINSAILEYIVLNRLAIYTYIFCFIQIEFNQFSWIDAKVYIYIMCRQPLSDYFTIAYIFLCLQAKRTILFDLLHTLFMLIWLKTIDFSMNTNAISVLSFYFLELCGQSCIYLWYESRPHRSLLAGWPNNK